MNPNLWARTSHTFFSSFLKIDDLINFAKENSYTYVSLIEKNVLYSSYEFYKKAIKNNLKPIIGLEIKQDNFHKVYLIKNFKGYKNLIKVSSQINTNREFDKKLIDSNLIELPLDFPINSFINLDDKKYLKIFAKSNSIELEENIEKLLTEKEFINKYGKDKLEKIKQIVNQINLVITNEKISFPNQFLDSKTPPHQILKEKLTTLLQKYLSKNPKLDKSKYLKRVNHEFKIISKLNFELYFLMVEDIVKFAKQNNIFVGPGRGSAAGSLVVFLLDITTIDPLKNNLIFERFLNPKRVSMPDIDIDFEDIKREKIINYIVKRFGYQNVASIITFQSFKARLALKDALRIFNVSPIEANKITKLVYENKSLKDSYQSNKKFRYLIEENDSYKKAFQFSTKIEGLVRQFSTHAAGLVIADKAIENYIPIQDGYNENILQTQYSMNFLEENGLIKVDILGLRNLTFINDILTLIKKHYDKTIKLKEIDLFDDKVYKIFSSGNTAGIFQFESDGMIKVLKSLKPDKFEDLVAATSLFRPGPMEQISSFIKRKHKMEEITYIDSSFKSILKDTYGIIVYQEQILQILQTFAGFDLASADLFRRAIGKKDIQMLKNLKEDFTKGAKANGHSEETTEKVYQLIFKFSNYGFNRSHAYAYSLISYQLAWLKNHYTLEFAISLLNSVIGNKDKTIKYIDEFNKMNIEIVPISLKNNLFKCGKIGNNKIQMGLETLKGIGTNTLKEIESEREKGDFIDFVDFVVRMNLRKISKTNIITLIKGGSLDYLNLTRNTMINNIDSIIEYAKLITLKEGEEYKIDYSIMNKPILKEYPKNDYSKFEIEAYGFSFVESEFDKYKAKLKSEIKNLVEIEKIEDIQDKDYIIAGELSSLREIRTKRNQLMAYATFKDASSKISATLWPAVYLKFKDQITIGKIYIIEGKIDLKRNKTIIVKELKKFN